MITNNYGQIFIDFLRKHNNSDKPEQRKIIRLCIENKIMIQKGSLLYL